MAETISPNTKRIAVVTGANRGIGFEICRQLASRDIRVVLTARDVNGGNEAVEKLKSLGLSDVVFHQLDLMDSASITSLANFVETQFGKLDILVNNAGIVGAIVNAEFWKNLNLGVDVNTTVEKAATLKHHVKQTYETAGNCLATNYYGIKKLTKALIPLLQLSNSAKIVNVSSSMGQLKCILNERAKKELGDVDGLTEEKVDNLVEEFLEDVKENLVEKKGWPTLFSAYIVSKAALNAYTRVLAKKYPKIAVNCVHPGYVSTDINENTGVLTVEEGAKGAVMLALMPEGGPSGLYFDQMEVSTFE